MQRLHQQRVRPERRGDPGPQGGGGGDGRGDVVLDVVPAPEQQRYEDGLACTEGVQGVRQERRVELYVAEADVEPGAQFADPVQERGDGLGGARVPAAVGDGDQGGGGGRRAVRGKVPDAVHGVHGRGRTLPGRCMAVTRVFRRLTGEARRPGGPSAPPRTANRCSMTWATPSSSLVRACVSTAARTAGWALAMA